MEFSFYDWCINNNRVDFLNVSNDISCLWRLVPGQNWHFKLHTLVISR